MSSDLVLRLDNVSYGSFPTVSELFPLSNNLARSFISFIRSLGIGSRDQMSHFLHSSPEDVDRLCLKCHLNAETDPSVISGAVEYRRLWQREILGGLTRKFEVDLREVLNRARERNAFYPLDTIAKEVGYFLDNLLKRLTGKVRPKGVINYKQVDEILQSCHLTPVRTWAEAQKDADYVRELMVNAFPHIPASLMANYLFDDHPVTQNLTYYCLRHRINRPQISHNTPIHREEQIAFVKWIGYDVKTFIAEQAEKNHSWRRYL
ncbi:hypothetical protein IIZ77_03160 [Candidatus Saccharibacteria bacterium]|nr:hypothetical protein [Candidatus Saccharibacteria bacterium]